MMVGVTEILQERKLLQMSSRVELDSPPVFLSSFVYLVLYFWNSLMKLEKVSLLI